MELRNERSTPKGAGDPRAARISVVVPVRDGEADLARCLDALARSTVPPLEVIVVDDGSRDGSAEVARARGARVVRLPSSRGPAFARNRGAELARGEILFFTDADVCVHADALEVAARDLAAHPDEVAVIGSYDDDPGHPSFVSQYKNLFHHWIHQTSNEEAWTFWTGCGAMRRDVFLQMGGFNEGYGKPSIEDIELGFRLRHAGYKLRLEKRMLAKHLKQWKFWNLVHTDVFKRGVPWIALMMRDRYAAKDLNVSSASRMSTVLAYLLVASLLVFPLLGRPFAVLPLLAFLAAAVLCMKLGEKSTGGVAPFTWRSVLAVLLAAGAPAAAFAWRPDVVAAFPLALLAGIVLSHGQFYVMLSPLRGIGFAIGAVPLHLGFFLCCGVCIPLGVLEHARDRRRARRSSAGPAIRTLRPLSVVPQDRVAGESGS
jgi:GT2 family glycosyltransferase